MRACLSQRSAYLNVHRHLRSPERRYIPTAHTARLTPLRLFHTPSALRIDEETSECKTVEMDTQAAAENLEALSPKELVARINELEAKLKDTTARMAALTAANASSETQQVGAEQERDVSLRSKKVKKEPKPFDFSRYSTRLVALKFAYLGHRYNGLEHANGGIAPLRPTVEEALWKALRKARLIPPDVPEGCDGSFDVLFDEQERKRLYWHRGPEKIRLELDWEGLAYSKCGRTDKGVSAFGQVIGVKLRSNRPKVQPSESVDCDLVDVENIREPLAFDEIKDELPYISILNSVLPPDIRVLAWCPNPDQSFDARFSCRERRYKYFFTNPAFCPTPGPLGLKHASGQAASVREGWLDIEAMRKGAKKLEGLHDFRNFCKIDASKQMSSCQRRITFADIEEMPGGIDLNCFVKDSRLNQLGEGADMTNGVTESSNGLISHGPKVYAFAVHGTAFLWHQVRCMAAVLFLIGQGLEDPELVDELLDIARNPARPHYEMADDAPLVLWDCVFPGDEPGDEGGLDWIYAGDEASVPALIKKGDSQYDGKFGVGGLVSDLWAEWRGAKMKETLTAGLLSLALSQGDGTSLDRSGFRIGTSPHSRSQRIFDGDDSARTIGDYTPVMQKLRMDTLEVQNAKYLAGKQARRDLKKSQSRDDE